MKGPLMPYIEGCFSFNDLDTNNYKTKLTERYKIFKYFKGHNKGGGKGSKILFGWN